MRSKFTTLDGDTLELCLAVKHLSFSVSDDIEPIRLTVDEVEVLRDDLERYARALRDNEAPLQLSTKELVVLSMYQADTTPHDDSFFDHPTKEYDPNLMFDLSDEPTGGVL